MSEADADTSLSKVDAELQKATARARSQRWLEWSDTWDGTTLSDVLEETRVGLESTKKIVSARIQQATDEAQEASSRAEAAMRETALKEAAMSAAQAEAARATAAAAVRR